MTGQEIEPYVSVEGEVLLEGELAAKLRNLLATVPVRDESGSANIVEQLFTAESALDLNNPWDAHGGREFDGKLLRFEQVEVLESQFEGGVGAFLIIKGTDEADHKPFTMTTSALAVIVQMARLHAEGWLPAWGTVEMAKRATSKGYYPYHLRFVPPPPVQTPK